MKSLRIKFGLSALIFVFMLSCKKGDTYCKQPIKITGVYGMKSVYLPTEPVSVSLLFENEKETTELSQRRLKFPESAHYEET